MDFTAVRLRFAARNFYPLVARTPHRPLAARSIRPVEALILAAMLALISFVLILPLGWPVIRLSFIALFLAVTYPFTKRFFVLPQAYLGIAFGFGIPMAYAAQLGHVPANAWLLLLGNIFWTIAYDTEYAMVDRADDRRIGIRTSAILFGRFDVPAVVMCQAAFLLTLAWVGWLQHLAWPYYAGLLGVVPVVLHQYDLIRERDPQKCFRAFLSNNWAGASIFAGIVLAYLVTA
jgi:4-hydroxybenzoate polyprenyltransferase